MPSNHLILCCPFSSCPQIFPSIRIFSNESALLLRWPKDWSCSFSTESIINSFYFLLIKTILFYFFNNLYSLTLSLNCLLFLSLVTEGIYKYCFVTKKKSNNLEVFKVEGNHSASLNPHLLFSSPELAISLVCIIAELIYAFT